MGEELGYSIDELEFIGRICSFLGLMIGLDQVIEGVPEADIFFFELEVIQKKIGIEMMKGGGSVWIEAGMAGKTSDRENKRPKKRIHALSYRLNWKSSN